MNSFALILPYCIALLPFLAFGGSYLLQRPTLQTNTTQQNARIIQRNAAISGGSILLVAILSLLAQGKLTGNPIVDMFSVLTLATTLQIETFRPFQGFLRGDPIEVSSLQPSSQFPVSSPQTPQPPTSSS